MLSATVRADQSAGTIRISLPSTGGAVSVELSSDREPERKWSARVAGQPGVTFSDLPPASYHVVVTVAGQAPVGADVAVAAGEVVSVELAGAALSVIDRRARTQGTSFTESQLRRLPTGAGVWGLLDLAAPFAIADRIDAGGLGLATPARIGSRGAAWRDTSFRVDGFRALVGPTSPDQISIVPNLADYESVLLASGSAPADVASPGATVALVPRLPPTTRRGAVDAMFSAAGLVSDNSSATAPPIAWLESWKSAGARFGGPLRPRTGLFVSASTAGSTERERRSTSDLRSSLATAFAHLILNPAERTQWRVLASVERARQPYRALRALAPSIDERDLFIRSLAGWEHHTESGARVSASVALQRASFSPPAATSVLAISFDRATDGPVPGPIADATAGEMAGTLLFAPPEIRGHAIEFGVALSHERSTWFSPIGPRVEELVAGLPARVWTWDFPGDVSERRITRVAGYVNDRVRLGPRATMDLGLRLSEATGSAAGAAGGISWTGVLPRVAIRWAPKPMTVFVGWGRYQPDLTPHLLAFGDPGEPVGQVHRWNDVNGDKRFQLEEAGSQVAVAGRALSIASIDPALKSPHADEFTFGAERRFGSSVLVSVTGTMRREQGIPRSVNTGVPLSSYQQRLVQDQGVFYDSSDDDRLLPVYDRLPASFGQDRYLLTNVDADTATYEGIEIAASVTKARWWSFAGASAYRSEVAGGNRGFRSDENDHGVIGEIFENPNANSYAVGRSFFDRAYVLKWATGFEVPGDVSAAIVARYQDGQPFSRLVVVPDLAQGPELVAAYPSGRTRFTFTATVDARIEKRFAMGTRQAALRLEVYNLTNLGLEVEENPLTGANFRKTTAVQPPRTLRLGFHVAF